MFRLVFVLDLFNGAVVHAIRGVRELYEPVHLFSTVVQSSDPINIIEDLAPKEVYIADLDSLASSGNNLSLINEISKRTDTMADIGILALSDIQKLPKRCFPVLGTETASLELIRDACETREIILSIDMKNRQIITQDPSLKQGPLELIAELNDLPLSEIIMLELDRVGTSKGIDQTFLENIVSLSDHDLLFGGGVGDISDLEILDDIGITGALVATAIHDGRIPAEMIQ